MKKILIVLGIISITVYACAQTNFADLPVKSTSSSADERTIVSFGATYRMSTSVLQSDLFDSLTIHLDTLQAIRTDVNANLDSLAIHLDTLQAHNIRILAVESGVESTDSSWQSITVDTIYGVERIAFGDGDTYIEESADDDLDIVAGTEQIMRWNNAEAIFYKDISFNTDDALSIGAIGAAPAEVWGHYFRFKEQATSPTPAANTGSLYMSDADEKIYFENSTTTYDLTSSHDAVTLNASATAGGMSLSGQDIRNRVATNAQTGYASDAHITAIEANTAEIADTVVIPYTIPWAFIDSAGMQAGRDYAPFYWPGPDTLRIDTVIVGSITVTQTPNFSFNLFTGPSVNAAGTAIFGSSQTVTVTSITTGNKYSTFARDYIIPREWTWVEFDDRTVVPDNGATLQINGQVY